MNIVMLDIISTNHFHWRGQGSFKLCSSVPAAMRVAPRPTHTTTTAMKVPASKFVKFIRLMSNCYILPLRYSGDFSQVTFSILHWKSFVSTFVASIPFLITIVVWLVIIQIDFIPLWIEKSMKVYTTFDMAFIVGIIINYLNPFSLSRKDFKIRMMK